MDRDRFPGDRNYQTLIEMREPCPLAARGRQQAAKDAAALSRIIKELYGAQQPQLSSEEETAVVEATKKRINVKYFGAARCRATAPPSMTSREQIKDKPPGDEEP